MAADGKTEKSDEKEAEQQVVVPEQQQQEEEGEGEEEAKSRKPSFEQAVVRSGKRQRKAADTFAPSVSFYTAEPKQNRAVAVAAAVVPVVGRGTKLSLIPEIRDSIQSAPKVLAEIKNAYRLMYRPPSRTSFQEMRQSILDFSGYLPVFQGQEDEEKQNQMVEDAEVCSISCHSVLPCHCEVVCDDNVVLLCCIAQYKWLE